MNVELARHRAELALLEPVVQAASYTTELRGITGADSDDGPELVVHFDADEAGRTRGVSLGFVPLTDDDDDDDDDDTDTDSSVSYLQMFSPLPFATTPAQRDDLRRAIAIVNEHTAIGRFGLDPDGTLYYRYVLASRLHTTIDPDLLIELIAMVEFHQEHYGDFLEGVTDGGIAIEVLDAVIRHAG